MIPTLLLIILLTFIILNVVPGKPGQQGGNQGTQSKMSVSSQESYQIFREQFNLDKPIVYNTRFNLTRADVEPMVEAAASAIYRCKNSEKLPHCIEVDGTLDMGYAVNSQQDLLDYGAYIVPELIDIAENHPKTAVRAYALAQLSSNAKFDVAAAFGTDMSKKERRLNKKLVERNRKIDDWRLDPKAVTPEKIDKIIAEKWKPWLEKYRDRFRYTTGEKVDAFFTDTRFYKYITNLITLDFGISHVDKKPVLQTIGNKLKYSLTLSFLSIFFAYIISVPLGVWSAYNQHTTIDQVVTVILFILYSLPSFAVAIILLEYTATGNPIEWFPLGGFVGPNPEAMTTLEYLGSVAWHLILPVACLTYRSLAALSRYARSGILDVIRADYIRTAKAKGLSEPVVIVKHAVRNGMIPVLTIMGTLLPTLIGGSVVIESIFNIPGIGLYLLDSIFARDYNALMGVLVISSVLTLLGILISDISYAIVDPRISFDDE
jgi:peptide/nickel transport system permease protein